MRSYTWQVGAVAVGIALGLGASVPLAQGQGKLPTIPVGEIKDGMKGYGLTVFKGTEPEKFDVEVIGVLKNFRPSQELILIKTPHPRLNSAKIVRGMSGSPIFLDGRLAGAYAYGYNFMTDPVAGVTPIAPMLTEMNRPIPPGFWPLEGAGPLPAAKPGQPAPRPHASLTGFDGQPGSYDVTAHAKQLAGKIGLPPDASRPNVRASTPMMLGGVGDRTLKALRELFEPLGIEPMQAGGGTGVPDAATPKHYANGGALGVALASGDVSFMGLGTTTYVEGTKVAGFGHPMMEAGNSALPTCIGRVIWLMSSVASSWKMGECARPLGALIQDRQSAIIVDETKIAPIFPVDVKVSGVEGAPKLSWHVDVAEEKFMSASIVAAVFASVIEATVNERRDLTWQMHSRLVVRGQKTQKTIELDDFGVAVGGAPEVPEFFHTAIVRTIGDVMNNPWENVRIEKVETSMSVQYTRDVWRLRGVELLDPIVDAGERVRVRLHLLPFIGPAVVREVEVRLPRELAGKDVDIEVVPGWDVLPEMAAPENLGELLNNSTRQTQPRTVVLQFRVPGQGVTFQGHVAGRLPSFALDTLRPTSADIVPDTYNAYRRTIVPIDKYIEGRDRVRVKVRPIVR